VAEFLVLLGSFQYSILWTALACIGIILAAAYLLYMIRKVLLGPLNPKWAQLAEINPREIITLAPLMVLVLAVGIYPKIILNTMSATLDALLTNMGVLLQ